MYNFVDLCESTDCNKCGLLKNKCTGDRKHPVKRLDEHYHYFQGKALSSEKRIILISAGKQSGKTTMGPGWMLHQMQICGDGDYLAVSSTFPLQQKKLIPAYLDFFCENGLNIGTFRSADKILVIDGMNIKAKIFFGSAKNANSLESSTALAAHLDESGQDEFTAKSYDAVLGRLSRSSGKQLHTTTVYSLGWLYDRIYVPWTKGDPDIEVIQFESIMSPGFSKREYMWLQSKLPPWQFDREYKGLFTRPTGMIYSDFNEQLHIIEPFEIPKHWNWHVGIDPGGVHLALVWAVEDPTTKRHYITHSYLEGNMTTSEHVGSAKSRPEYGRVIDWRGGSGSEGQVRLDWKSHGIVVREPPIRDVEAMIDRVTSLLKEGRLFIFNTEQNKVSNTTTGEKSLVEEFRSYSRVIGSDGKPTEEIKDDKKFHKLAALRYLVSGLSGTTDSSRFRNIVSSKRKW